MADNKPFYMKVYERDAGLLVAVCDKNLVGKKIKADDVEVNISTHFYKEKQAGSDAVLQALKSAWTGNFFGKKAVKLAIKTGLVDEEVVKEIAGVPHAQFVRMEK